jgi:plastocyanin
MMRLKEIQISIRSLMTPAVMISLMMLLGTSTTFAKAKHETHTVTIEGMKFTPESLTVKAGDTVVWVNKDIVPHTATGVQKEFDSKEIKAEGTWKLVAKKKGNVAYVCNFHPTMKAMLTVE